jgi:hypothetical protein
MSTEIVKAPLAQRWTDKFALELAMTLEGSGDKLPVLLGAYEMTDADLVDMVKDPIFEQRVRKYQLDLRERGLSFRMKAQVQAEDLLTRSWELIHDERTSPAVIAELIKWTAKVAGFDVAQAASADSGVKINIIMGGVDAAVPAGVRVIEP